MRDYLLEIVHENQLRFNYCGPACLKMILDRYEHTETQHVLWEKLQTLNQNKNNWYTDPESIASYLNIIDSVPRNNLIDDYSHTEHVNAISKVVSNIIHYNLPCSILVYGGRHWVNVIGVKASFNDNNFENGMLHGIFIADPAVSVTGVEYKPITRSFFDDYFSPVEIEGLWINRRVIVGDGTSNVIDNLGLVSPIRPVGGGISLNYDDVESLVLEDLLRDGFSNSRGILGGGGDLKPFFINYYNSTLGYYISPIEISGSLMWAVFSSLDMSVTSLLTVPDIVLMPSNPEIIKDIKRQFPTSKDIKIREGLWWKKCIETPSNFNFFRIVYIDDKEAFYTNDRRIIQKLHTLPAELARFG
ncbi:hypothetical protein H4F24_14765 [Vibrio alginolyticus]|uniref:hypothetical protein n=1 Tax=Vibrio alginolyticus TaxID=663 RepID=UPI002119D1DE|nr:hypothetical protein [Vibrio alginolyticus]MCQ9038253.1 hypothetical protein [Vibrio alginolyticus]